MTNHLQVHCTISYFHILNGFVIAILTGTSLMLSESVGQTVSPYELIAEVDSASPGSHGGFGGQLEANEGVFVVRGTTAGLPDGKQTLQVHSSLDGSLVNSIVVNRGDSYFPSNWPTESFAINEGRTLVGAFSQIATLNPGRVFPESTQLFDLQSGDLLQTFETPSDAVGFGYATALQGNLALVSDPMLRRVHVYDVSTGNELTTLAPTEIVVDDPSSPSFGMDLAISGDRIAVADQVRNAVFIYDLETFELTDTINYLDPPSSLWYGSSIDLEGDSLVVGSLNRGPFGPSAGRVFVYDLASETSIELMDDHHVRFGVSGFDVEIDGDLIAVGASYRSGAFQNGQVFLFNASNSQFIGSVSKPSTGLNTQWGWYTAIDDGSLVVGNPQASFTKDGVSYNKVGRVYIYRVPEPNSLFLASILATVPFQTRKRKSNRKIS